MAVFLTEIESNITMNLSFTDCRSIKANEIIVSCIIYNVVFA